MNDEQPSVLDYVKARLMPWKGPPPAIPLVHAPQATASSQTISQAVEQTVQENQNVAGEAAWSLAQDETAPGTSSTAVALPRKLTRPWRSLSALGLAVLAQGMLEPGPDPNRWKPAVVVYAAALACLVWAAWRKEWLPSALPERDFQPEPFSFRLPSFLAALVVIGLAYLTFGNNRFTTLNVLLWVAGLVLAGYALWLPGKRSTTAAGLARLVNSLQKPRWRIELSQFAILWMAVLAVAVYFRFSQLAQVPPEMNSDHAEKLLDVVDILDGQYSIFFPRNTGREPLQFYLIALTAQVFGAGVSFMSMKIGTALAGLLALPFIYLAGKEIANRQAGLLAMAFAGIAAWPNILARVALRFSFYPLFVASALYFLLRGLRGGRRNDFILAGLSLGLGLLGYTPIRILPFVIVTAMILFVLHYPGPNPRQRVLFGLALVAFFAFAVALPLLRFAQDNPEIFAYRAFSRITDLDRPLAKPAGIIFLENLKNAMLMFGWNDGLIWPISIPNRPALDVISAALFYLGLALLIVRYLRQRKWEDLFLLLAVPLLMLPSILSLAFPLENPAPNRASGAMFAVFLIIGLSLDGLLNSLKSRRLAGLATIILFGIAAAQNHSLVFIQYQEQYALSAWNTSEMGRALSRFAATTGSLESSWVVKSAHWVDTRLVGIHAGSPKRDFGIDLVDIPATISDSGPKLFLVRHFARPEDRSEEEQALLILTQVYPMGWAQMYSSRYSGKDFWMFFVPPAIPGLQTPLYPENTTP